MNERSYPLAEMDLLADCIRLQDTYIRDLYRTGAEADVLTDAWAAMRALVEREVWLERQDYVRTRQP